MIAVQLRVVAKPQKREEMIRRVHEGLLEATRAEDGCIDYRFYQDTEDANAFSFVEQWRDWDAIDDHFRSAHVGAFLEVLGDLLAADPVARFQEVSETRGLEEVERARSSLST